MTRIVENAAGAIAKIPKEVIAARCIVLELYWALVAKRGACICKVNLGQRIDANGNSIR